MYDAGFVDSVYLSVWEDGGRSFHWAEMNLTGKFGDEDTPAFDTSGTEDFFLSSWGWSAGPFAQRFHGHPVHRENGWNSQYRYFPSGLWFQDGLTLTWALGPTDAPRGGGGEAPVRVWWVVTYYVLEDG